MERVIVILPTYEEHENIGELLEALLGLGEHLCVLVVDDNSRDGTAETVEEMQSDRVHLIRNEVRKGRGVSGVQGFQFALDHRYDFAIEMDADFSHHPRFIPALLEGARNYSVVIGSRLVPGGGERGRTFFRKLATRLSSGYLRLMLGYPVKDPTSGFRCFSLRALEEMDLPTLRSRGPFIITETLYRCYQRGLSLGEIPIVIEERKKGKSKLTPLILMDCLLEALKLRIMGSKALGSGNRGREGIQEAPGRRAGELKPIFSKGGTERWSRAEREQ